MPHTRILLALILSGTFAGTLGAVPALAQGWNSASGYNGYGANSQNTPSNASLRDPNGNLTLVDGQFRSSNFSSQSGTQFSSATSGGVGTNSAGAQFGQASAIGNSLNVVVLGSHNTTVVDTTQINNGNQTATTDLNAH